MQRPEDRYGGSPAEIWRNPNHPTAPPPVNGTIPEQFLHHQQPPPIVAPSYPYPVPPEQPPYHVVQVGYQSYGCPVAPPTVMTDGVPLKLVRVRERSLPCCGLGLGWALFIAGFFLAAVPWYVGTVILFFVVIDHREKAGLVACTVGAALAAITTILGMSHRELFW
ncbi:hypothetical protein ZOSMA_48G00130 [Zostera marina]|uniref:60S ribosomal protein L18a-like protein n=1 Tax=Zostera marina TaxID=29655 RepID=A0A0K9NZE7_ZOSMR|nr:hypothetical protein ZOSMA_48G00130 [Zostera marina]